MTLIITASCNNVIKAQAHPTILIDTDPRNLVLEAKALSECAKGNAVPTPRID